MSNRLQCGVAAGVLGAMWVAGAPVSAAPSSLAVQVASGPSYQRGSFANFGYTFKLTAPVSVTALGVLDVGANGLADAHEVGLWDSTGALLRSTTVTTASTDVAAGSASLKWEFEAVTPLTIQPGDYTVGAYYPTPDDFFLGTSNGVEPSFYTSEQVQYGQWLVTTGGTQFFARPDVALGAVFQPGGFGPNLQFTAVPEPTAAALLAAPAMLVMRRRR